MDYYRMKSAYKKYRRVILSQYGNDPMRITHPTPNFIELSSSIKEAFDYILKNDIIYYDSYKIIDRHFLPTDRIYRNDWRLINGEPYMPISMKGVLDTMVIKSTHPLIFTSSTKKDIKNIRHETYGNDIVFPDFNTLDEFEFELRMRL